MKFPHLFQLIELKKVQLSLQQLLMDYLNQDLLHLRWELQKIQEKIKVGILKTILTRNQRLQYQLYQKRQLVWNYKRYQLLLNEFPKEKLKNLKKLLILIPLTTYIKFQEQKTLKILMQSIRKFFLEFDMFGHSAMLRVKQDPQMKTASAGIVSFGFIVLFAYVFISSSIEVINFTQINTVQSTGLIKSKKANGNFTMFAITLDWLDLSTFQTMFDFQITVVKKGQAVKNLDLIECYPDQWKLLGDSYKQDFENEDLGYMLCPNTTDIFELNETLRSRTPTYLYIALKACNPSTRPSCDTTKTSQYLTNASTAIGDGAAIISIYVLDKNIEIDNKNPLDYYINIDTKIPVTDKFGGIALVQFGSFLVETDVCIWPFKQIETVNGVSISNIRNYQASISTISTDTLARASLVLNQQRVKYQRVVGKVDELLSYAGGLFGIIIGFLAIIMSSFNEYRYQLTVAEGVFNYDESGRRITDSYLNFLRYIKYTIFDWIQVIFCCQMNWTDCKDINETREQIVAQMEVHRIFKRIQNLQGLVKQLTNENERLCYNLVSKPTLEKVKSERLLIDYYEACVGEEPPILVEDVRFNGQDTVVNPDKRRLGGNLNSGKVADSSAFGGDSSAISFQSVRIQENRVDILQKIVDSLPQIKKQAEELQLPQDLNETENRLAEAFATLPTGTKTKIQEKMPVIIVCRLLAKINQEKNLKLLVEDFKL